MFEVKLLDGTDIGLDVTIEWNGHTIIGKLESVRHSILGGSSIQILSGDTSYGLSNLDPDHPIAYEVAP
jgi:hypothetical protein